MKTYLEVEAKLRILTLGTRSEWSASRPGHFIPREWASGTRCI